MFRAGTGQSETLTECGRRWREEISDDEKARYAEMAKKEKEKKKKDPKAPKDARRAYNFFLQDVLEELKAAGIGSKEGFIECGKRWKVISPSERARDEEMVAKDKERYKAEWAE